MTEQFPLSEPDREPHRPGPPAPDSGEAATAEPPAQRPPPGTVEYRDLRTIWSGPLNEALILQAALAVRGFRTFIDDENLRRIDPFTLGGYAFHVQLQALASAAPHAAAKIAEIRAESALEAAPEAAAEAALARVQALRRRIMWSCLGGISAPIGVALGLRYLAEPRPPEASPRQHRLAVAAIFIAVLESMALVVSLGLLLHR